MVKKITQWRFALFNETAPNMGDALMIINASSYSDAWEFFVRHFPDYETRYDHLHINGKRIY